MYYTDTYKSDEDDEIPLASLNPSSGRDKSAYTEVKRITCPADFTGLLAHPETCKKFLQCANGATYIMDCGPGTAFNPVTTVCDWPYKVPSCKTGDDTSIIVYILINDINNVNQYLQCSIFSRDNLRSYFFQYFDENSIFLYHSNNQC